MPIDKLLLDLLNKIQDNKFLRTKKGLFFVLVLIYFIVSCKIRPFSTQLYNDILLFIIVSIYSLFWFYFSGRIFFSSKIKILFAIDCSEEAANYFNRIEKTILSKIDDLNIARSIKIIKMPSDFIVSDRNAAEKYVKRRMIDLLVWVLLTEETKDSIIAKLKGIDLTGVQFRTKTELGLQDLEWSKDERVSLIDGIDNLKCIPLTNALCETYKDLQRVRDQV